VANRPKISRSTALDAQLLDNIALRLVQRDRFHVVSVLIILIFPLVLVMLNDSWVFPFMAGYLDPYYYTGYFMDLKQHLNIFPDLYYGTRLPWLLLGGLIHGLLPPEAASYTLRLTLLYAACFALFVTIRLLFQNNLAATVGAMLVAVYTPLLSSVGWDYVDGFGVVLMLVTIAFLTAAATKAKCQVLLLCAGAALISTVLSYMMLLLLVPIELGFYLLVNSYRSRHPLWASGAWLSAGALGALAVMSAASWQLTGNLLFFMPQVRVLKIIGKAPGRWKAADYSWIGHATWLVIPAIAIGLGFILLLRFALERKRPAEWTELHRSVAACTLPLIAAGCLFLAMEAKGFWLLQIPYYAIYLTPFAFLAIGAVMSYVIAAPSWKGALLFSVITAICLLAPFRLVWLQHSTACASTCELSGRLGWLAALVFVVLAISVLWRRGWLIIPALVPFGIFNMAAATNGELTIPPSANLRNENLMVYDAIAALRPYTTDGKLRFWYNTKEPSGWLFRAIASTHIWTYRLVSEDFPNRTQLPSDPVPELQVGDSVVILSSRADALQLAETNVAKISAHAELLGQARVQRGTEAFQLFFVRILPAGARIAENISLAAMKPSTPDSVRASGAGIVVQTLPIPWSYAAVAPLPAAIQDRLGECRGLAKAHVQVEDGPVGLGILAKGGRSFVSRKMLTPTLEAVDVFLDIPKLSEASDIVVQAWDPARKSRVAISSITIMPFGCPPER